MEIPVLSAQTIRLEPLEDHHGDALLAIALGDRSTFGFTWVPSDAVAMDEYIAIARSHQDQDLAAPFAIVDRRTGRVLGSTRLCKLERWDWPPHHERFGHHGFDVGEIGYTWLTPDAQRTSVNAEAKLALLTYAFSKLGLLRVQLMTDERNLKSRKAIERIGARLDGILRSDRLAADATSRNTAVYSITKDEWTALSLRFPALIRQRS